MKRGGPLRRASPGARSARLVRTTRIRQQSRARPAVTPEERSARKVVRARSGGVCEGCGRARATDWSHRKAEGQGGPWCPSNGLHLCRGCHDWLHAHPVEARAKGWMVLSGHDHETRPALLAHRGWVFLTRGGDFIPTSIEGEA